MSKAATKTSSFFTRRRDEQQQVRNKVRELTDAISNGRPLQRDPRDREQRQQDNHVDDTVPAGLQRSRG